MLRGDVTLPVRGGSSHERIVIDYTCLMRKMKHFVFKPGECKRGFLTCDFVRDGNNGRFPPGKRQRFGGGGSSVTLNPGRVFPPPTATATPVVGRGLSPEWHCAMTSCVSVVTP